MPSDPQVDDYYYQEFYAGVAEDEGKVLGVGETLHHSDGHVRKRRADV